MDIGWIIGLIVIFVVIAAILIASIRVIKQSTSVVVERLGVYKRSLQPGLRFLIPFIDKCVKTVSLKEMVADFKPQPVITKDNVTMQIDTVVYYQVTDPKLFTYGVDRPISAIENLTATTLRNIVGELELDQTLTSRDTVNAQMRVIIDEVTDAWGIKVNRVELKNILPPRDIQESMEKQMRAERERRESILRAEGEKQSQILVAEGEKAAAVLRAEAKKISLLTEAEGQSEAIKRIIAAKPDAAYLTLQGFEALKHLADGEATKIIVPSNIQDVAGLLTSLTEVVRSPSPEKKAKTASAKSVPVVEKLASKQPTAKK